MDGWTFKNYLRAAAVFLVVLLIAIILSSCTQEVESVEHKSNGITVYRITTIEGCGVYGIHRGTITTTVYTTICPSGQSSTQWSRSCGKSCTRTEMVDTVRKED